MQAKSYTPSVNIIRDEERELNYYVTPNSSDVVARMVNHYKLGLRSFNIIGTYGTGKSSLLWAFEQDLKKKQTFFNASFVDNPSLKIVKIVGDFNSIIDEFAQVFNVQNEVNREKFILSEIYNTYHDLGDKSPLLVIIIDEFGKFLEYAANNEPERELYFIQKLAEFVNNLNYNICLITTIHQNFDAYSNVLSKNQKQEWTKVKGRFQEITFNEPVEQLLFLASEYLGDKNTKLSIPNIDKVIQFSEATKIFRFSKVFTEKVAHNLFPLDIISAYILTVALQRYGQNERSLFSFLATSDDSGLGELTPSDGSPYYNLSNVYDYLIYNYYSYLNSGNNQDLVAWGGVKNALDKVERYFNDEKQILAYTKIVKTLGLLSIFAPKGSVLLDEFLDAYSSYCLGIHNSAEIIQDLSNRKVIIKKIFSNRYHPLEGTDIDIHGEIRDAANRVNEITDIVSALGKYYTLPPTLAKMESYLSGTPRLFEYVISETPIQKVAEGEVDGYVNLIFNDSLDLKTIKSFSKTNSEAIVIGYFQNTKLIQETLFEIEKIQKVIVENTDDYVAIRELKSILTGHQILLNQYLVDSFYNGNIKWIFDGKVVDVKSKKDFNKLLSIVCKTRYGLSPRFRNELVNKHKVSGQIHNARKLFFKHLVNYWNTPDFGFEKDQFPPQKTIFLSLIKENGINFISDKADFKVSIASDSYFKPVWDYCESFLVKAKSVKLPLSELFNGLERKPYKMKRGLIEFWLPTFLFIKRQEFALFNDNKFIPELNDEILEIISRNPNKFEIKTFNLDGVRLELFNSYRILLNQSTEIQFNAKSFIQTIKPFLKFYSGLPEYSKQTKRLSKEALQLRDAIAKSKDPEKSIFEDFPLALGYSLSEIQNSTDSLKNYVSSLENILRELRTCYDRLESRLEKFIIEEFIGDETSFEDYKAKIQDRFKNLQKPLLMPDEKAFISKLDSPIEDKQAWFGGIIHSLMNKQLLNFRDEDEALFYQKLKKMISDLDNLTNLSNISVDTEKEEVISVQISSFGEGVNKSLVRLPKSKQPIIKNIETTIRQQLSEDKNVNIAVLSNLLNELLKDDKS